MWFSVPTEELEGRERVLQKILRNHHTIPGKLRSFFGILSLINEKKISSGPENKNRKNKQVNCKKKNRSMVYKKNM